MDVISTILKPVADLLMKHVVRHVEHYISCKTYVENMNRKMNELRAKRISVEGHLDRNTRSRLEVPANAEDWLKKVGKIDEKVKAISSDVGGCVDLKMRHKLGRKASDLIKAIESVSKICAELTWTDRPIPLAKVDSPKSSISMPSTDHPKDFPSREHIFTEALKALKPNHKSHMVALCGMGGVGKTTIMQRLKKAAEQTKMFEYIVEVVFGEKTNPIAIQESVAKYRSIDLKETDKLARAERLRKWFKDNSKGGETKFESNSKGGETKFLIILDDVWHSIDLNDIGLSPLPDQGVNFKVLLTSRDRQVCSEMGVEVDSILNVGLLPEADAQTLFRQYSGTADQELQKIGDDIARKCRGLPLAIKTMACALKIKKKDAWKDALSRLERHAADDPVVNEVFKLSYEHLHNDETKSVFLLCGMFPEDFSIPTEDLVRYGWGLKLFKRVHNITEARARLNTCIERLIHTNLLMDSDEVGYVKMHDLVLAFVLDMFTKVEHAVLVNHGSKIGWSDNDMSGSYKKLSLTCSGMSEFPTDLKFPNLSFLKLMHGDESMEFPQDFYRDMENLQVISYDIMKCGLPTLSPQCSTNIRVLHIHKCTLSSDCSPIGNLLNLEVLSFTDSGIEWLPSAIGNLEKLRLLDLTNCRRLRIDKGVLKKLVNLEELYMRVAYEGPLSLTDDNCNEMEGLSENLLALEFEFKDNNVQLQKMSFGKLQRFKISVGRFLDLEFCNSLENTLQLVTNKAELQKSKLNKLFEKTEVLRLNVGDMHDLEDVEAKSSYPHQSFSFYNLRVLVVSECTELRYLFTLGVANTFSKLEHLEVYSCDNMEELIHTEGSGEETITFPKLKYLSLDELPRLLGLCLNDNIIELPQLLGLKLKGIPGFTSIYPANKKKSSSFLKEEVVIPKLEKLKIGSMEDLKEIWPCKFGTSEEVKVSMLREITVWSCPNLVNLFPCNPMPLIQHLEELQVSDCDSIEVLFKIDLDCVAEIGEGSSNSSLKRISLYTLEKLREVWRIKGADNSHHLVRGFQAVEYIRIYECGRFRNIFTSINKKLDLGGLLEISIENCGEYQRNNESTESRQEQIDSISNAVVPSSLIHSLPNLRKLNLWRYKEVEAVFEIKSPVSSRELVTTHHNQPPLLPFLEELDIFKMDSIHHIWKCNWNKFLTIQKQPSESSFHNLTTIKVEYCNVIQYLFSPLMAKLLSNLEDIKIVECGGLEEVVSNRDDEDEDEGKTTFTSAATHTSTTLFPRLDFLSLESLPRLKCIGGGGHANRANNETSSRNSTRTTAFVDQSKFSEAGGVSWSLCQFAREIKISSCPELSSVIPCYAVGQMQKIQRLRVKDCGGMKEVFGGTAAIPGPNNGVMLQLANLKILQISDCHSLEHILTFSALESLRQLEELVVVRCTTMRVIVKKEEDGEQTEAPSKAVVFPRLKSIGLYDLPELVGFFLGMNEFHWPELDTVFIDGCPKMTVFVPGGSTTPKLKYIHTSLGKHSLECGLNFHVTTTVHPHHQNPFPSLESCLATSEGIPWSLHNLIELNVWSDDDIKKIVPSSGLVQLQKLEQVHVGFCDMVREVFEALEAGTVSTGSSDESKATVVTLPNLTQVKVEDLPSLRWIWKSNPWTVFQFPNLTRVYINDCYKLQYVFTTSMVGSLLQLQELHIEDCESLEAVIVKDSKVVVEEEKDETEEEEEEEEEYETEEEEKDETEEEEEEESDCEINEITLPRLKSLKLVGLSCLKGFCLRKKDFSLSLLDTLRIKSCPEMKIFTNGNVDTPQLKNIEISRGSFHDAGEDINSFIKLNQQELKELESEE